MKKMFFTLLMIFISTVGISQTIGEAFYVYRSDGMINTFFRSEIDSIAYSYYDTDSLLYSEVVSQVVYTPDSIYQIPLAVIDSVGFATPETKYQPGVIRLEGEIRNYIIGSDSLVVFFRSDTPSRILPKVGDKLVTTEMSDVFAGGFIGQVEGMSQKGDTIFLHCDAIGIEEVFECFYYSTNGVPQDNPQKARALEWDWNNYYAPGPFVFSYTSFLDASFEPIDCPWVLTPQLDVTIAPSFRSKGSIIVHPLRGVVISMDIKQHTSFIKDEAVSGEINTKRDFHPAILPMYPILPFVFIYGDVGFFIEANLKLALEEHLSQSLDYNIHYEASYLPMFPMPIPTSIPKFKITNVNLTTNHDIKFMADGYIAGGLYGEIGIVPLLTKHIAEAGFRFEGGIKLGGNVMIYNSDGNSLLTSTSLYEKLLSRELYVKPFCRVGMTAKLIGVGNGEVNLFEHDWDLGHFKLVPEFSNTTLKRQQDTSTTLIAATTASGSTIVPCTLRFKLFEGKEETGIKGTSPYDYWSLYGYPELYYDTFESQSPTKNYTVYPTVDIFGIEMLATPSAELKLGVKPITLNVENVGVTTAKVWGRIEGYEFLDETAEFGFGYWQLYGDGTVLFNKASSLDADGFFSVELMDLKSYNTYKYFAYLIIDGETYYGEKKQFETKENKRKVYGVITENGTHLSYYYDENKNEHVGEIVNVPYNPATTYNCHDIREVTFDASFYDYEPTSTENWFINMHSLTTITNLHYLNTAKVTNMNRMFGGCNSLTSLDLNNFNTTNVTSMYEMFAYCETLSNLNLSKFNTANVTTMWGMFSNCSSLSTLDISNFNTENVINISYMFADCSSLKSINASGLNTTNLKFMGHVFEGCSSLTYLDLSSFNTTKVTGMPHMFGGCRSLTAIDLSSFNTDNVTDISYMFSDCSSLETIYAGNWKPTSGYDNGYRMFMGCEKLTGGNGTKIGNNLYGYDNYGNPLYYYCPDNRSAAHIDGGKDNPGLFTAK